MISAQYQNIMITAAFFEMSQTDIIAQTVKNHIQHDFSDARQDRSRSKKLD